jgi:cytochrome P450
MCLSMAFAMYEMKVVLIPLYLTFRLTRPPGCRSVAGRRGIAMAPNDGAVIAVAGANA